ncbi:plant cysteine oxidase 2-like isoform X1 [Gossypium australe]|uniref:cysteine dioxygenase n=1 Tax=Gossypium australe TaxID=47621 RepID=A0A5B6V5C8_9ROSI|nr:plant cysteine oxidase 2-like isoform X1 [Gossypium australe]
MGRATVADIKGRDFSELDKEAKANTENTNKGSNTNKNRNTTTSDSRGRKNRRRQKKTMVVHPVQRLFDACKNVFAHAGTGFVPPPDKIEQLSALLDDIKPVDVGLSPRMPFFSPQATRRAPTITYLHIHECEKFSMGIFCLPPSGVLPLHNHPGMTVFSKLLFGTMHIKSYDWVVGAPGSASAVAEPSQTAQRSEVQLAKVKVDSNLTAPCKSSILYPADGGNMHCFTAVTACAVLDVLGPPYSDAEGRPCTYYLAYPFTKFSGDEQVSIPDEEKDNYAWLQERDKPEDLVVEGALYTGPVIREN